MGLQGPTATSLFGSLRFVPRKIPVSLSHGIRSVRIPCMRFEENIFKVAWWDSFASGGTNVCTIRQVC